MNRFGTKFCGGCEAVLFCLFGLLLVLSWQQAAELVRAVPLHHHHHHTAAVRAADAAGGSAVFCLLT